jgi:hypothetical protein
MDVDEWIRNRSGIVSIDTDFFTNVAEQGLAAQVTDWLSRRVDGGVPVVFRDEHVDLVELVSRPVDFAVNLDYHMDLRLEFLHGEPARTPPSSASVFETLLADGLVEKYIWAFPSERRRTASMVYSSAFVTGRQPLLAQIHCVDGRYALDRIMSRVGLVSIFVCRSPDYATAETDAIYDSLRRVAGPDASATA